MIRYFFLLVGLTPLTLQAAEQQVLLTREITYSTIKDTPLQLDLAVPKGNGPFPCIICFHGGAWKSGHRRDLSTPNSLVPSGYGAKDSLIEVFAKNGYAAATVSYRLAPKYQFPAQIEDAKAAVRFLRANAKKYQLNPDKFVALGFSAGGHLAALLGTTDAKAGFDVGVHDQVSSRVQAVVDFFGPADLSLYCETPLVDSAFMVPLLGKECQSDRKLYDRASPITYVSKDDPPVLILHGTADIVVPILHSERFEKKLKDAGVPVELVKFKGRGHGWTGEDVDESARIVLKFLKERLKTPEKK